MKRVAVAVLLSALLAAAGCQSHVALRVTEQPAVVGTYCVDAEASYFATTVFAGRDEESYRSYRQLTIPTDGTWTGKFTTEGKTRASRGTWSAEGDDLSLVEVSPWDGLQINVRQRDGVLELLHYTERPYWVMRRAVAR